MLFVFQIYCTTSFAQQVNIELKSEKKSTLKNFRIINVTSEIENQVALGNIKTAPHHASTTLYLAGGVPTAFQQFLEKHVTQKGTDSIELRISKLNISQTQKGKFLKTVVDMKFSFFQNDTRLIDYSAAPYITSNTDVSPQIGLLIAQGLETVLKEFDQWYAHYEKPKITAEKELKLSISFGKTASSANEIIYKKNQPLKISDFQASPDYNQTAAAATFSGFSTRFSTSEDKDFFYLKIEVLPYMDKTASWMKPEGKNDWVLHHEQAHFDIAASITCEFFKALESTTFAAENYKQKIQELQTTYLNKLNETQQLFDEQTDHGQIRTKQMEWNKLIEERLQSVDCY